MKVKDKYLKSFVITEQMINDFAENTYDKNPVHLNEEFASGTIFKKRIAHGMLIGGLISSILGNDFPGNGTIYLNQTMTFRKPIFIDETVDIVIEVVEVMEKGWLSLTTNCFVDDIMVIEGSAIVIPPKAK